MKVMSVTEIGVPPDMSEESLAGKFSFLAKVESVGEGSKNKEKFDANFKVCTREDFSRADRPDIYDEYVYSEGESVKKALLCLSERD